MSGDENRRLETEAANAGQNASVNEPDGYSPFPIVGIGASAGGLEAFQQLLAELPPDINMAFLLCSHLVATQESHLPDILSRITRLPVVQASHGDPVRPGHIYVIAPNTCVAVATGLHHVTPRDQPGLYLPIDHLFRSLAVEQHGRAIGVVLSGTGSDGTMGLCEIKGQAVLHSPRAKPRPAMTVCHTAPSRAAAWILCWSPKLLRASWWTLPTIRIWSRSSALNLCPRLTSTTKKSFR